MDPQLLQTFHSELLTPLFSEILTNLSKKGNRKIVVAISYAWPILPEEVQLQEQVLRLSEDLTRVGITVLLDLLSCSLSSDFSSLLVHHIQHSDIALLIGSPSYASRALDSSTVTYSEVQALIAKKACNPEGVVPALLVGRFQSSFPPGYTDIMGCDFHLPVLYMQYFPSLAAKLLGVHQEKDVRILLDKYDQNISNILQEAPFPDVTSIKNRQLQNSRFWSSRVAVKISGFTHNQLLLLDGCIANRERSIYDYSKETLAKENAPLSLPEDLSATPYLPLEQRLCDFLNGSARVLLLQAPQGAGKTLACKYLASIAWQKQQFIPVFITLDSTKHTPLHDHLVEEELASHGLDSATVQQAQESHSFLIIVEGFDSCGVQKNIYIQHKLHLWPGKTVFTCRTNYLANAPYACFYFMPQAANNQADPCGLLVISFTTKYTNYTETSDLQAAGRVSLESLKVVRQTISPTINSARERWHKAIKRVRANRRFQTIVFQYSSVMREGFMLLQRDIVGVMMHRFLSNISGLTASVQSEKIYAKAFISYAWPPAGPERTKLQSRLVQLVDDLKEANIKVTLDILHLRVGMNITNFMKNGIVESNAVLWIGTPGLKSRIRFQKDGTPDNPATEEFVYMQTKAQSNIHLLWFSGNTLESSYPVEGHLQKFIDFRNEREYFHSLPLLAATILQVFHLPDFREQYSQYLGELLAIEKTFTEASILKCLQQRSQEAEKQKTLTEATLEQLLNAMPEHYRLQQIAAEEALSQGLNSRMLRARTNALAPDTPHALALSLYIPLLGGAKPDSPEVKQFSVSEKVRDFVLNEGPVRVLLIQGSAGSGKSLCLRLLENQLWKLDTAVLPIFIPLTHLTDPFSNIAALACRSAGFSDDDILLLKATKRVIFIIDGIDEISLDHFPPIGVVASNHLLEWSLAKVIITTRPDFLLSLETHLTCSYRQHLTQGLTELDELFLMPFNETQMNKYIQLYATTEDSDWKGWKRYSTYLDSILGLRELARNPFTLKLLLNVIPQFSAHSIVSLTKTAVYEAFSQHYFRKEMWKEITHSNIPLQEDRPTRLGILAEKLGQELFARSTTRAAVSLDENDAKILRGLPVQQFTDGTFSFVHKSLQEFFTARRWAKAISGTEEDRLQSLGVQLIGSENGLVEFLLEYFRANLHFEPLLAQVYASRSLTLQSDSHNIASANAMTILVAAKSNLSLMDLSHICASGANLDGIIADYSNLSQSNLTGASLRQAWLRNADLKGANLSRVQLGQYFQLPGKKIIFMAAFKNKILIIDSSGACLWNIDRRIGEVIFSNYKLHGTWFAREDEIVCVAQGSQSSFQFWQAPKGRVITCDNIPSRTFQYLVHQDRVITVHEYEARVWDINTCQQTLPPLTHRRIILCAAGYKDRISICAGDRIFIWSLLTGELLHNSPLLSESITQIRLYAGKVVGASYYTQIWDISTNQISKIKLNSKCCSLVVEAGIAIFGCLNGTLQVFDLSTCQQVGDTFVAHADSVSFVALLNSKIVSATSSEIRTWEIPQSTFQTHQSQVLHIAARGLKLSLGFSNNTIQVYEKMDRHFVLYGTLQLSSTVLCMDVNDQWLVSGTMTEISLRSMTAWPIQIQILETAKDIVNPSLYYASLVAVSSTLIASSIVYSKTSSQLETFVRVWDISSKHLLFKYEAKDTCVQMTFCGDLLFFGLSDGTVVLWQSKTNTKRKFKIPWPSRSLPVHPQFMAQPLQFTPIM